MGRTGTVDVSELLFHLYYKYGLVNMEWHTHSIPTFHRTGTNRATLKSNQQKLLHPA